jgi:hypothetical protein
MMAQLGALAGPPTRSRWLGRILVAQGAVGLVLLLPTLAVLASLLVGQVGGSGLAGSLDETLERAQVSVADAARATRAADAALASTGTSAVETSAMLSELASAMREGSASLRISVFGQQPFVPLAESFARTAERADLAAESIATTGPRIEVTRRSMTDLSADLDTLSLKLAEVRASAPSELPAMVLGILLVAIVGWLAVAAAICLALGWRLLQPAPGLPELGSASDGDGRTPVRGTIGRAS